MCLSACLCLRGCAVCTMAKRYILLEMGHCQYFRLVSVFGIWKYRGIGLVAILPTRHYILQQKCLSTRIASAPEYDFTTLNHTPTLSPQTPTSWVTDVVAIWHIPKCHFANKCTAKICTSGIFIFSMLRSYSRQRRTISCFPAIASYLLILLCLYIICERFLVAKCHDTATSLSVGKIVKHRY